MDCKIEGRQPKQTPDLKPVEYGLEGLAPGQQKFAHRRANAFLEKVMMDPTAPEHLKTIIRQQNAVGMVFLQILLAAYFRAEYATVDKIE